MLFRSVRPGAPFGPILDARLMHGRGLRVFHESEVASGVVVERMRLHKVADAKQKRLGEPGQAIRLHFIMLRSSRAET